MLQNYFTSLQVLVARNIIWNRLFSNLTIACERLQV